MRTEVSDLPRALRLRDLAMLLALAAMLALAPLAAGAQTPADEEEQARDAAARQTRDDDEPPAPARRPDEPQAPTGAEHLPQVPDPQRPGEPPPTIEDEDPGVDQVEKTELGSFFLTSVSFASAYDDLSNDTLTSSGPTDDTDDDSNIEYLAVPSFLFVHRPSARGELVVAYEPEIRSRQEDDEEQVSHSAGLVWDRRMSRRSDLTAGASYLDSLDPTRHLGGEGFVLIPGEFEQTRAFFGASHLWPRSTRLHFYTEYATAKTDVDSDDDVLDVDDISGTLALEQGIGRRSQFTASYSYTETDVKESESELAPRESLSGPIDTFRLGFGHDLGALAFHVSGGAQRELAHGAETEDDITWIGAAEVSRETNLTTMRLRYDRSLFAFGYGNSAVPAGVEGPLADGAALRDTTADTIAFFLELHPQSRIRFEQSLWLSRESLVEGDEVESFVTGSLVEVLLTGKSVHRLLLFSRFDYYDRGTSELLGAALSRTRFSLGFRVGLTGPQTKVGQRLATTELRKVLPSAGRL